MGRNDSNGVGLGIRLTRSELKRLDELAQAMGHTRTQVIRVLINATSPRDNETVRNLTDKLRVLEAADATR